MQITAHVTLIVSDARFANELYHLLRQERTDDGAWRIIEGVSIVGTDPKTGQSVVPPLYRLADPTLSMVYHIRGVVRSAWYSSEEFQEQGVELESNADALIPWGIPIHISIRQPVLIVDVGTSDDAPIAFHSADGDAYYRIDSIAAAHEEELDLFRLLRPLAYTIAHSVEHEKHAKPHKVDDLLFHPWKGATLRQVWREVVSLCRSSCGFRGLIPEDNLAGSFSFGLGGRDEQHLRKFTLLQATTSSLGASPVCFFYVLRNIFSEIST